MGLKGKLTLDRFGFSMPVDAPLYPSPPYIYKDATLLVFNYATDPEAAAALLPAGLEVPDEGATAGLVFASYPWCNLGAYDEVVLFLNAMFQGERVQYAAYLYVTTDAAMAAGREMGGFPKKIARIAISSGQAHMGSMERPAGLPICSGILRPESRVMTIDAKAPMALNYVSLRVLPSPQKGTPPTVAELVETRWAFDSGEVWSATGSCQLSGASALDPLHKVPIVQPLGCELIRGNMVVAANDDRRQYPL